MKPKKSLAILGGGVVWLLMASLGIELRASPTSAFTYQGQLQQGGAAASGAFDFQFSLWNGVTGGTQVGVPQTVEAVAVSNGLFTVSLDFGGAVFDGSNRWLEIGVRTNGNPDGWTVLSPRQPLTATPYAILAESANEAAVAADLVSGGATLTNIAASNLVGLIPVEKLSGITSNQFDSGTWAALTSGGGPAVYVLPETGVWTIQPTNVIITNILASGPVSSNLGAIPPSGLALDLNAWDAAFVTATQTVNVTLAANRPKPFWLTISNATAVPIPLSWPPNWFWSTEIPTSLAAGAIGVLSGVSDVNGLVVASWTAAIEPPDPDVQAFVARAGVTNAAHVEAFRQFVKGLKVGGFWADLDLIYPFYPGTNANAWAMNLKGTDHTITWHNNPILDSQGVTGDGVAAYGDTGFYFTNGVAYQRDSAHLFVYSGSASPQPAATAAFIGGTHWGAGAGSRRAILYRYNNVLTFDGLNDDTVRGPNANTWVHCGGSCAGLFNGAMILSRTDSTNVFVALGNDAPVTWTWPSVGAPDARCGVLAMIDHLGNPDRFSTVNLRGASVGGAISLAKWAEYKALWTTLETALGRP